MRDVSHALDGDHHLSAGSDRSGEEFVPRTVAITIRENSKESDMGKAERPDF